MWYWWHLQQKKRALKKCSNQHRSCQKYLKSHIRPKLPLLQAPILALDFETTGLHPQKDHLVSAGWVTLKDWQIHLATAKHTYVAHRQQRIGSDAIIHGITHEKTLNGLDEGELLQQLLQAAAGKVILAHHAPIEKAFLDALCLKHLGFKLPFVFMDTLSIEKRRREQAQQSYNGNSLRLFNLRKEHGLPRYLAHNALVDAIATGELFLAQMASQKKRLLHEFI